MIPVIEKGGGAVLVRARVDRIVVEHNRAVGVTLESGMTIRAPCIISDAGVHNTFEKLLEPVVRQQVPSIDRVLSQVRHGPGCMSVFVGLNGSNEELGLQATNVWSFFQGKKTEHSVKPSAGLRPCMYLLKWHF